MRVAIRHPVQLHQRQRRLGLAVPEDFRSLLVIQLQLPVHSGDVVRLRVGGVDLTLKLPEQFAVTVTVLPIQHHLAGGRAEVVGARPELTHFGS